MTSCCFSSFVRWLWNRTPINFTNFMFVLFNNGCCNCPPSDMSTMLMVNILFCLFDGTPYCFSLPVVGGMDCLNQFRWYHSSLGICKFESFHINFSWLLLLSLSIAILWLWIVLNHVSSFQRFYSWWSHAGITRMVGQSVFSDPIDPMTLLFCIPLEIWLSITLIIHLPVLLLNIFW